MDENMAETNRGKMNRGNIARFEKGSVKRYAEHVDGNTVRKTLQNLPEEGSRQPSRQVIRNRQRARHMDMRYVLFLSVCAAMTVVICIHYLKLHAQYTYLQKQAASLSLQLNDLKMENDTTYNEIVSGVDLQKIKDRAINDLGMTYPKQSQIVTYGSPDSDYVKQYGEIPSK